MNFFFKVDGNDVLTTFGDFFFETKFFARFFSSSDVIVEKYFWWKILRWKKNRRKNCIFKKFKNIFWVDSACPPRWLFWKCHLNYWIEPGHTPLKDLCLLFPCLLASCENTDVLVHPLPGRVGRSYLVVL